MAFTEETYKKLESGFLKLADKGINFLASKEKAMSTNDLPIIKNDSGSIAYYSDILEKITNRAYSDPKEIYDDMSVIESQFDLFGHFRAIFEHIHQKYIKYIDRAFYTPKEQEYYDMLKAVNEYEKFLKDHPTHIDNIEKLYAFNSDSVINRLPKKINPL